MLCILALTLWVIIRGYEISLHVSRLKHIHHYRHGEFVVTSRREMPFGASRVDSDSFRHDLAASMLCILALKTFSVHIGGAELLLDWVGACGHVATSNTTPQLVWWSGYWNISL